MDVELAIATVFIVCAVILAYNAIFGSMYNIVTQVAFNLMVLIQIMTIIYACVILCS